MPRPVGYKVTEETKEKIRKSRIGKGSPWKNHTKQTLEEKYAYHRAYTKTEEAMRLRRLADARRHATPEYLERQRLRRSTPEEKEKARIKSKLWRATERGRQYKKEYRATQEFKDARRNQLLLKNFGITLERYKEMLAEQNGVCAICLEPERFALKGNLHSLAVDHCHVTGKIRGLLCKCCNQAIGQLRDNVENLKRAIEYLSR